MKLKNDMSKHQLTKKRLYDAGLDICASKSGVISAKSSGLISTQLFIAIPAQCVGLIWSRSGLSVNRDIEVGAGCIDSGYRGEVIVKVYNHGDQDFEYQRGDKVAQLLTVPVLLAGYQEVDNLSDTDRGTDGFGSTGINDYINAV